MSWLSLIQYIPDLIKLIEAIKKRIDEVETDRKVKDDLQSIKKAFDENDISHLNAVFNSKLPDSSTEKQ